MGESETHKVKAKDKAKKVKVQAKAQAHRERERKREKAKQSSAAQRAATLSWREQVTERGRVRERAQRVALKFASNFAFAAVASRVSRKASASILMAAMSLAKQRAEGYLVNARRRQRRLRRQRRRRQRRKSFACIYFHFRLWPRTWQTTPHTHTDTHTPPSPCWCPAQLMHIMYFY